MNSSEVVETSDDDELELNWKNGVQDFSRFSGNYPPIKRRKLSHNFDSDSSPSRTPARSSSNIYHESTRFSQIPPTSPHSNVRRVTRDESREILSSPLSPFNSPWSYEAEPPQSENIDDDNILPAISSSSSPLPAEIDHLHNELMEPSKSTVPSISPPDSSLNIVLADGSKRLHLDLQPLNSLGSLEHQDLLPGSPSVPSLHSKNASPGTYSRTSTPTSPVLLHLSSQFKSPSPDPLLISEPQPSDHRSSPLASPATPTRDNQRLENLFSPGPLTPHDRDAPSSLPTTPAPDNERLEDLFSPGPLTPQDLPLNLPLGHSQDMRGPSTPDHSPTPPLAVTRESYSPPQNSPSQTLPHDSLQPTVLIPNEPENDLTSDIPQNMRYPLRRRAAAQLRPYTVEKFHYTKALEANPEAIVKIREITRMRNDDYDQTNNHLDDSQALWQPIEETQDDSDREWRGPRERPSHRAEGTSGTSQPEKEHSEFLQLSEDDEEIVNTRKEVKRLERARREQQRREKLPRHRPFPIRIPSHSGQRGTSVDTQDERLSRHSATAPEVAPSGSEPPFSPTPPQIPSPTSFSNLHSPSPRNDPDIQNPTIISDGESSPGSSSEVEVEIQDVLPKRKERRLPKDLRILQSMYPRSMINQLGAHAQGSQSKPKPKPRASSSSESEAEEDFGQRSGWHNHSWDRTKETKDDQESPKEEALSVWDSEDDNVGDASNAFGLDDDDGASIMELSSDSDSEVERLDPFQIEAYLAGDYVPDFKEKQASNSGSMREGSLINWMLPSRIGRPRRRKTQKRRRPAARISDVHSHSYRIDVVTHGARRERQTRLDFSGHTGKSAKIHARRYGSPSHARSGPSHPRRDPQRARPALPKGYREHEQPGAQSDTRAHRTDRKQDKGEPRKRAKDNGVHVFASNGRTVISGGRRRAMITMHVENDAEFARAIAPLALDPPMPLQSARSINTILKEKQVVPPERRHALEDEVEERRAKSYCVDCGISVLQSGLSFKENSVIRKGWLHELIGVVRCEILPSRPVSVTFHDIDLGPDMGGNVFIRSLKQIFDGLFEVSTSLVGIENADEEREWLVLQRAANQSLSWLLTSAPDAEAQLLRNAVQEEILGFVSRMRAETFDSPSLDTFTLSICWFCVEISTRLDVSSQPSAPNVAFDRSVTLLMKHLWVYGFDPVLVLITAGNFSEGPSLAQHVTELWVSLIHVLDNRKETGEPSRKRSHPFSSFLQEAIDTTSKPSENPLKSSESIWRSIFSLCALSQFSVHGMTTSAIRMPASWSLVSYALKQIRLTVDPSADQNLSQTSLDQRDNYAGWIVKRCFLLWSRWHWQLDDVSSVFDSLSKIFQTRHFAGFYYETHDYPVFLRDNDWTSLTKLEPQDTAFSVFLKLLVQAVGCDESNPKRSLSSKAKKMLSMAFSVTKIPFSKTTRTTVQDLSTLHNRLATVAVGIYLEPLSHEQRLKTARIYVDFSDADNTARLWVIHGMTCLAIMLRSANLSMEGIAGWVEEMTTVLQKEHETLGPSSVQKLNQIRVDVNLLADAVRKILQTYQFKSEYPEPRLLQAFKPSTLKIFIDGELTTIREILKMLFLFLDARKKALPPPERPRTTPAATDSQESQDEYSMMDDLDYGDPALLAALDNIGGGYDLPEDTTDDIQAKEATLNSTWAKVMKVMNDNWKGIPDAFRKRLDLTVMKILLKLDPMTYLDYPNEYLECLVTTLVSTNPGYDRDFIRLFFDIDRCRPQLLTLGIMNDTDGNDLNNPAERPPADILQGCA
ncbi:hypothetical protein H0H92_012783 [Tricholoma furcatifolium]|nr:hypothetical protein H0H92_012783 [Tricholoma furcatifolium]